VPGGNFALRIRKNGFGLDLNDKFSKNKQFFMKKAAKWNVLLNIFSKPTNQ